KLQKVLGKKVELVEYAEDLPTFVRNLFKPVEVSDLHVDEGTGKVDVFIRRKNDLGFAIGKGGANVEKARILLRRFFHQDIGEVIWGGVGDGK
ncbi:MAG: KH domain-containing protein, partial [Methanomicrobiales archaeon]|nr:KH domain-containing protein [Methanomicrobiales archaeon]